MFYALQIYSFLPTPPPNQRVKTTPFGESSRFLPPIVLQDGVNISLVAALERERIHALKMETTTCNTR